MKSIRKNYILIVVGTMLLINNNCSDFLEEKDKSHYTQGDYFQTAEQAKSFVNKLYEGLRFVTDGAGTYGESPFMMLEFPTGLLNTEVGQSTSNLGYRNLSGNAEDNYVKTWWERSYNGIQNANVIIARVPDIQMDEATKKRYIGEAKFIRAFHYFNLVRMFGDIPLILEVINTDSEQLYPERNPQNEVYEAIVNDLTDAEKSGLPMSDNTGRVSLGAIKSLLSSVYLTMVGYPLQAGDEYYKMAADKAKEVMDSGAYQLFDDYDDLHNRNIKNTGELIFQNQYSVSANITSSLTSWLLPRSKNISKFSDEVGAMYPIKAFIDAHETNDKRIEEQEFYFTHYPSIDNPSQQVQFNAHYIYKFFDEDAVLNTARSDLNWTFIRYAEVLLNYAEAGYKASGTTPEVTEAINKIRRRANLPEYGAGNPLTEEAIWKERFYELAFENKYWFDMVRRRKALNLSTNKFEDLVGHTFNYGPVFTEKYFLFPIPQSEIDNNKKLKQNPDW